MCETAAQLGDETAVENPLAKRILEGDFAAEDTIRVDVKMGVIGFEKA